MKSNQEIILKQGFIVKYVKHIQRSDDIINAHILLTHLQQLSTHGSSYFI